MGRVANDGIGGPDFGTSTRTAGDSIVGLTSVTQPSDHPPTPRPGQSAPDGAEVVPASTLTSRERFLRASRCLPVDHAPIWLMRQAGRVLPEYRALKERYTFVELVRSPELAAEVTLQPIRRFGFDAAIIFSDILVIPEAMGQAYRFREAGGVEMDFRLSDARDLARLTPDAVEERLAYVAEALRLVKKELANRTALIGFSGAPWTLANFMVEGGSSPSFQRARELFRTRRADYDGLARKLTEATIRYLRLQIEAGAEALQIFDTLAGLLPAEEFEEASGRWIREIVRAMEGRVPVIVFAKGAQASLPTLVELGADALGFDAESDLRGLRAKVPAGIAIQGNLAPTLLETTPTVVVQEARRVLEAMRGRPGHIFNLGHGVPPAAPLENITALVETVRTFA